MAFWLWLEDNGYPNIVVRLIRLTDSVINMVAEEAVTLLNCLAPSAPVPPSSSIVSTVRIMQQDIPIEALHQNKSCSVIGLKYFLNNVCAHIFTDVLHEIVAATSGAKRFYEQLQIPGFPHPVFGEVTILRLPLEAIFPSEDYLWGGGSGWNERVRPARDGTFPYSQSDVDQFFERLRNGLCVDGKVVYPLTDPSATKWLYNCLKPWTQGYIGGGIQ
ncbi:hypothetical protein Dimus_019365 [Dionaea muscipula]